MKKWIKSIKNTVGEIVKVILFIVLVLFCLWAGISYQKALIKKAIEEHEQEKNK